MIATCLLSLAFSIMYVLKEKLSWFVLSYLSLLPFVILSGLSPLILFFSFSLGYLLFCLWRVPSPSNMIIFLIVLITSFVVIHPRSGLDFGMLNAINAQRGEHAGYEISLFPKLLHNKTDLAQSFISNFDKLLSPVAIFASGFWHRISPYYPLGFLFPWDLYFIYRYFNANKVSFGHRSLIYFLPALTCLLFLSGFVYLDQALVFSLGVVYFLALLAAQGYSSVSKQTKIVFIVLNSFFLVYHLLVTPYFKI